MKNITRKVLMALLVLSLAAMTVYAGGGQQGGAAKSGKIVIAACMQGNQSGFVRYMVSGMNEYHKTVANDVELKVVFADDDPAKQQSQVEQFVSEGVNAIILNPVDKVQSAAAVDFAAQNKVPVITINTISDSKNVTAHVGSDDVEAGTLQLERLLKAAKDQNITNPRIAYINAVIGHSAQVFREQAYKQVLAKHPEAKLVIQNTADWSGEKALQLTENWIQSYSRGNDPGLDIIATQADCLIVGTITAVENAGYAGKILLGGMDCDMPVMEKIKAGVVDNSIWQDGLGQGEWSLRLAIDAAKGVKVSDHIIPYEVCTKENVDGYIKQAEARNALAAKYF
ncbi:MAG: substrate-binding domain-containing protein [Treponema sp.]|jgi:ABC-type sugar transport system substrate-binding protein|nr:substrate-binding domain-containing protein [Treponema sp.]